MVYLQGFSMTLAITGLISVVLTVARKGQLLVVG